MAETETEKEQQTTQTPGQYVPGGEQMWQDFLTRFYGDEQPISNEEFFNQVGPNAKQAWNQAVVEPGGLTWNKPGGDTFQISPNDNIAQLMQQYPSFKKYVQGEFPGTKDMDLLKEGPPGLYNLMENQRTYARNRYTDLYKEHILPAFDEYSNQLDTAMGAGDRFAERMQPIQDVYNRSLIDAASQTIPLSIGGQTFNLAPQGGVNLAGKYLKSQGRIPAKQYSHEAKVAPALAQKKLGAEINPWRSAVKRDVSLTPEQTKMDYIQNSLLPQATQVQNWRYGTPTQATSGHTSSGTELGGLGQAMMYSNLLGQGANILDSTGAFGDEGWLSGAIESGWDWASNLI